MKARISGRIKQVSTKDWRKPNKPKIMVKSARTVAAEILEKLKGKEK